MIQIVPQVRILVAVEPIDFRNGIDGLVRICKQKLACDAFCGWLFVFLNRRRTSVKILAYDQQGFWTNSMSNPRAQRCRSGNRNVVRYFS